MEPEKKKIQRIFKGRVVSNAMQKTLVVLVERIKTHAKYRKQYRVSKRFKVHNESGQYKVGDTVQFIECRPLSKDKRWRVLTHG